MIFRSGCSSNALWTVKPGRYVVIGSSRSSRPAATACMTAVAVNGFDIDWTLKIVSAFTGRGACPSSRPNPASHGTVAVDEGDGKSRDVLLGHQLRDALSILCDDRCSRVVRDDPVRRGDRSNRGCGWYRRPS